MSSSFPQSTPQSPESRSPFDPLPDRGTPGSAQERKVGVEIEFGSISPDDALNCIVDTFGGTVERKAAGDWAVTGGRYGDIALYLDTKLRPATDTPLARAGVELGRVLVPLEVVTEPLPQAALPKVETVISRLAEAGAAGSDASLLRGYGLHLNVELSDARAGSDMPRVALAFCLLESWLRHRDPPDPSRRILPFTDPLPDALTAELARAWPDLDLSRLLNALAKHVSSRNYALDLLPAWSAVAPESFARDVGNAGSVSARPAYHYRMPNCRIGNSNWSLSYEWNRWALVEAVATDDRRLSELVLARLQSWSGGASSPDDWHATVTSILGPLADRSPEVGADADGEGR
ncbi:amidoligase family protein [Tropicimonas isoalkanivorans]|uniref:Putative amidoligase enzyme n=1 Tax=Tropicimonas isoalkanivorans TaxID=441112 RepID=A0A1I1P183_9RHOB|nr:amidoligase family protein [Tropicimonas isoalkanivorans]SFD03485.1 Putative amidoligase enzyme [Tropicimonas isoalkanivorans]